MAFTKMSCTISSFFILYYIYFVFLKVSIAVHTCALLSLEAIGKYLTDPALQLCVLLHVIIRFVVMLYDSFNIPANDDIAWCTM